MKPLESVGIRRGEAADELALARVLRAGDAGGVQRLGLLPRMLDSSDHFVYLAETGAPFGFVGAGPGDGTLVSAGTGEIMALCLLPDFRGHGMGKKLLVRGLSVLKVRGFSDALAWVPAESLVARATFESLGFERDYGLSREINRAEGTLTEFGYLIDLAGYF